MLQKNKNITWFTLVEILVWILIFSMVMVWWFQALSTITIWKIRLIQKTDIEKESFYFTEKFFEMIKKWGTLDYEEYFNRKVVWTSSYTSWHYLEKTWFWNFWVWWTIWWETYWAWFYYCRSIDWTSMWENWCYNNNFNTWLSPDWEPQRYWEYSLQFIDYNSNYDWDSWNLWDEDWDWEIKWDDDDEYLWLWPNTFTSWEDIKELYLISWDKKIRTLFRWNVIEDPSYPLWNCDNIDSENPTWTWCLWTIQFLQLEWKDWWMDHNIWTIDIDWSQYDWVIDTWIISPDFAWWSTDTVAWSNSTDYWVDLFPDTINIRDFKIFAYPNKDINLAWKDSSENINLSPYIRLQFTLGSSWKNRKKMKWNPPEIKFSTTINLTDIYSK